MNLILIGSAAASLALFLLFIGVVVLVRANSADIAERVERLPVPSRPLALTASTSPRRAKPGLVSRLLATGTARDLPAELARAGLNLSPAGYVALNLLTMAAGFVFTFFLFHQNALVAIAGGFVGVMAPRWYLRYLQGKRMAAFEKQIPDVVTLLANSLRTGFSLLQAIASVSKEVTPPASEEFGRVVREVGLGLTLAEALANMVDRVPSDDLDFMISAVNIQYEVGGDLAKVLDTIARTIRERVRVLGEIRVLTTQQRFSALILALLPVGAALGLYLLNPGYMSLLWQTTCGIQMVVAGTFLVIIGHLAVQRIANIKV